MKTYCDECGHVYNPKPSDPTKDAYEPGKPDLACSKKPRGTLRAMTPGVQAHIDAAKEWERIADARATNTKDVLDQIMAFGFSVSTDGKRWKITAPEGADA